MQVLGHITKETAELYRLGRLPAAELLDAQTHAERCEECRARLAGAVDLGAAFARVREEFSAPSDPDGEPEHMPYEQLTAFVDGSLDDVEREMAESHLAVCADCAGDADDLRRYQAINAAARVREQSSARTEVASAAAAVPHARDRRSFRRRLLSFDFLPSFGVLVPAAVVATVVGVALLGLWVANHRSADSNRDQVARVNPPARQASPVNQGDSAPAQADPTATTSAESANPAPAASAESTTRASTPESIPPDINRREDLATASQQRNSAASQPKQLPRHTQKSPAGDAAPGTRPIQVALNDGGGRVLFDGRGDLRGLEGLPHAARGAVRRSLERRRVETPRPLDGPERGVLMSGAASPDARGGAGFALVGPVGRIVREDRPVLRWRTHGGASSYTVAVVDSSFRLVAESGPLAASEWTPPSPLRRGQVYFWQVTATLADGSRVTSPSAPAPQAKFRVLEEGAAGELKRAEESAPDSHLARGVLYARAGLLDEAEAEFRKLVALNPRSPVARRLLQSVRRR